MDTARTFKPRTILLWRKIADQPQAQRILSRFPDASVRLIEHQRHPTQHSVPSGKAVVEGKRTLMIGQTSSFIGCFDGRLGHNVRCCPYYKLTPLSNGCPYYCTYCYLAFVYRKYSPFIKININYDTMFKQIRKAAAASNGIASFNMGEMLDSLALDHITKLTTMLVPFFGGFSNAYLMLLTKSSNIDNLLSVEPNRQTVVSWSLNSDKAVTDFEPGTASLDERVNAARRCQQHGYRIRFRIDPGIFHENWKDEYAALIEKMFTNTRPENITIGMLRLLPGHARLAAQAYPHRAKQLLTDPLLKGASDRKLRYPPEKRIEFYSFLIGIIRSFNRNVSISLCRETPDVWHALRDRCTAGKCNCIAW